MFGMFGMFGILAMFGIFAMFAMFGRFAIFGIFAMLGIMGMFPIFAKSGMFCIGLFMLPIRAGSTGGPAPSMRMGGCGCGGSPEVAFCTMVDVLSPFDCENGG